LPDFYSGCAIGISGRLTEGLLLWRSQNQKGLTVSRGQVAKQAATKSFVLLMFDSEGRNGNPDAARALSSKISLRPKAAAVIRQHGIEPG
jgi:hypothetical protein